MDRRMGLVSVLAISWPRAVVQYALSEITPAWIAHLILNQRLKVDFAREDVRFRTRIADQALHVQLLGDLHRLLTRQSEFSTGEFFHLLQHSIGKSISAISRTPTTVSSAAGLHLDLFFALMSITLANGSSMIIS